MCVCECVCVSVSVRICVRVCEGVRCDDVFALHDVHTKAFSRYVLQLSFKIPAALHATVELASDTVNIRQHHQIICAKNLFGALATTSAATNCHL